MSHLSQMTGLAVQNFLSAGTGIALAFAVMRAFAAGGVTQLGNFWVDLTRITLWLLLPGALIAAFAFIAMGVPQTLAASVTATTLAGGEQTIALGPVAFQLAIKHLGTNGGGFFGVNSLHPFEGPSALATSLQIILQVVIPFGLCLAFGRIVGDARQGRMLLAVMVGFVLVATLAIYAAEAAGNPLHIAAGLSPAQGNMEGKDLRFGLALAALFTATTTGASCGAVNAMLDSFTPLGGLVPMFLIQLGEVLPGGVGSGLYGMLVFALLAVFVAGLMVGRTPEYLGKKVQAREVKLAMLAVLVLPAAILGFAGLSLVLEVGTASLQDAGPHGLSEMLYAFTSAAGNNGSAFGGLTADTPWLNTTLGIAMLAGRFGFVIPVLAIAGSLAAKPRAPEGPGTLPTHGPLFIGLLAGVILILGGLQYLPALALGPIAEHFAMLAGQNLLKALPMQTSIALFDGAILRRAALDAVLKLNLRHLVRNPVIFVTEVVSILVTILAVRDAAAGNAFGFQASVAAWLWLTVLFATFAEAVAEGRGKARAASLRAARGDTMARFVPLPESFGPDDTTLTIPRAAAELKRGDHVLVEAGEIIPSDGEIVQGIASVNESAVTGESAPVIREAGGDRSAVTGGTLVVSDRILVRTHRRGRRHLPGPYDRDGRGRLAQKNPNEIALDILLAGMTIIFLIAVVTLVGLASYSGSAPSMVVLAALLVTLIPTTIGGLLSAIGIAGMDRLVRFNVPGHVRPRGRGRGRRGRAAARQDRHHHLRQPPGSSLHRGTRRERGGDGRSRRAGQPGG